MLIDIDKFQEIDIRIGLVQEAKKVKFKKNYYIRLIIDFGPDIGVRTTILKDSDHILYEDFINRQIVGIVNIRPKKITGIVSDALLLGVDSQNDDFALLVPNRVSCIGSKVY